MPFSHLPRSALALGAVALLAGLPLVSLSSAARADSTHLTIATAMYREMGMAYWVERAEAEMRQSPGASVRSG